MSTRVHVYPERGQAASGGLKSTDKSVALSTIGFEFSNPILPHRAF